MRKIYKIIFTVALFFSAFISVFAQASKATGGTGVYRDVIYWLEWGNRNDPITEGKTITFEAVNSGITYTVRVYNVSGGPYADLYNSWNKNNFPVAYNWGTGTGSGTHNGYNDRVVAINTPSGGLVTFDVEITAALAGTVIPVKDFAFIIAGAESLYDNNEYYSLEILPDASGGIQPDAVVQPVETYTYDPDGEFHVKVTPSVGTTPTTNAIMGAKLQATNHSTAGDGKGDVMFAATHVNKLRVTIKGKGKQTIALGLIDLLDFGDAPASYDTGKGARHYTLPDLGGSLMTQTAVWDAQPNSQDLVALDEPILGIGKYVDSEDASLHSPNADGDDNDQPNPGIDDEDGIPGAKWFKDCPGPVKVHNYHENKDGYLHVWIDANDNGLFDTDEKFTETIEPGFDGYKYLDFRGHFGTGFQPQPGDTRMMRFRMSYGDNLNVSDLATSGEVEDYKIEFMVPEVVPLTSSVTCTDPQTTINFTNLPQTGWTITQTGTTDATYTSTVIDPDTGVTEDHKDIQLGEGTYKFVITNNSPDCGYEFNVTIFGDADCDGIDDQTDLDDDNDGILDCEEKGLSNNLSETFVVNDDAVFIENNSEIQLTPEERNKNGQVWSLTRADFSKSFTLKMEAYLGTIDNEGADGIAIVFHNDPNGTSASGEPGRGIGAKGIQNGIVLELDTYNNFTDIDPGPLQEDITEDHGHIWKSVDQSSLSSTTALPNLEDDAWHDVVIIWNKYSGELSYTVDGQIAGSYINPNIVTDIFGGEPNPYFGYTASTGWYKNFHKIRFNDVCNDLPLALDTDNDGIPNHLDLDSDNDGCLDAVEGGANLTAVVDASGTVTVGTGSSASNQNLGNDVDANGVPNAAQGGQAIGASQEAASIIMPVDLTSNSPVCEGDDATIEFTADTEGSDWTYQLQKKDGSSWVDVSGQTGAVPDNVAQTITLPGVTTTDAGDYRVKFLNPNNTCEHLSEEVNIEVNVSSIPMVGSVTQPTCTEENGSFQITNFVAGDSYTLSPDTGVSISDSGLVTAPAGTYTITHTTNPENCTSEPSAQIVVNEQPPTPPVPTIGEITQPTCETPTGSFQIVDYVDGDTYTFTPNTGVSISDSGLVTAPSGTYTFTHTNTDNCTSADSEMIVIDNVVCAVDDTVGPINGLTGGDAGINVLDNDTLNGDPVNPDDVTITPNTNGPLTVSADGAVTVAPNTPAGEYTVEYTVCEKLNPTNCDTATVTVTVKPALIDAVDDDFTATPVNGLEGGAAGDVLANDRLNGPQLMKTVWYKYRQEHRPENTL